MRPVAAVSCLFLLVLSAFGAESDLPGVLHTVWNKARGFPAGSVSAITEAEGYLWIGTERGLVRFDGTEFQLFQHSNYPELPRAPVRGVTTDGDGFLWIQTHESGLLRYRAGKFERISELLSEAGGVTAIGLDTRKQVIVAGQGLPLRFSQERFRPVVTAPSSVSRLAISIAEATDGTFWMGTRDAGLFGFRNNLVFSLKGLPDRKVNCLLPGTDGSLTIGTDAGAVLWNGREIVGDEALRVLGRVQVLTMIRDREANLWVGTNAGLAVISQDGRVLTKKDNGQHGNPVTALFEDREGTIWAGGTDGLESFRERPFLSYSVGSGSDGPGAGPVYVDGRNRVWFGKPSGGLFRLDRRESKGFRFEGFRGDVIYSIDGEGDEFWVGRQRGGLSHVVVVGDELRVTTFGKANGLGAESVYAVHRNRDKSIWAGTLGGGVSRIADGKITTYTSRDGLAANSVSAIEEGPDGTMWIATPNGLNAFRDGVWRNYSNQEGMPPGRINCLLADSDGVLWIGSDAGIAFVRNGEVLTGTALPEVLHEEILGMADDEKGVLWISTAHHVLRTLKQPLLEDRSSPSTVQEFGKANGISDTEGVRRNRSVVRDAAGRIWFALRNGLSVATPSRFSQAPAPPVLHIRSVTADGVRLRINDSVSVPPESRRLAFSFVGLSLSEPGRVRFRYRLDSFDSNWSEPDSAGEAVYTNLNPGRYIFRVIASNREGVWNSQETAIPVDVLPAFWQTWWFRVSLLAVLALGTLALYQWRVRLVTKRLHDRFEDRLAERTRIAQELHDTLLQGFLSASMHLEVATESVPPDSPVRKKLERTVALVRSVVAEGRNAVGGLRSGVEDTPLELALAKLGEQLRVPESTEFRVILEGRSRHMNPLLRDDVYRIGREAIANALRHANASVVEVEIRYSARGLDMMVRDNGCGIEQNILDHGKQGHWGLSDMQERADRVGAKIKVLSRRGGGTEIALSVPGHLAFDSVRGERSGKADLLGFVRRAIRNLRDGKDRRS